MSRHPVLYDFIQRVGSLNCRRASSWSSTSNASGPSVKTDDTDDVLRDAARRRRKVEWKRRQRGATFLDHLVINVRGGKGGDGCVAFHREKFKPYGPPSGGNGGRGGDVYIFPTPHLTSLSSVSARIRAAPGGNGQGTWQNGKNAPPTIIKVPLGTVVRELPVGHPQRAKNEWEAEEESLEGLSDEEREQKKREKRWRHYPRYEDDNVAREAFKEAERTLHRQERERRFERHQRDKESIYLDLDKAEDLVVPDDAPLGIRRDQPMGYLLASGGLGGLGNPHFLSQDNRSPKFATRGHDGQRFTFALELKILADVGLVGMPNAGKSTLLRALTGGRAKTEVASYAFTTLNPVVGTVRVAADGTFEGSAQDESTYDETIVEELRDRELMESGAYAFALTRNQRIAQSEGRPYRPGYHFDIAETFRFTIADNPGLIAHASEDVGLGHSFLRSMERSLALVYVVDLFGRAPWEELLVLREELEQYQPGMSRKARMVIANKADLLGGEGEESAVEEAKQKLAQLEEFVRGEMSIKKDDGGLRPLDVVATSGKYGQNLRKAVKLMQGYVEKARARLSASPSIES